MPKNTNNLPYFKARKKPEEKLLADFLLRKFRPRIKEKFPQHFLIQPIPSKALNFVKETSKKYPYFLRFDIRLYYPSINHQILLKKMSEIYQKIQHKQPSRRFKKYLKNEIPIFLSQSPYGKGLSIGSRLSWVLASVFLLDLDLNLKNPFLRQMDDYLVFCKNKKEPEFLLKNLILPKLTELNLEINEKKLKSGKFHQDKVNFIGFYFFAGYFTIQEEKIENFKKKIIKLTRLTRKKPQKAIIKSLNNQILGFGHYYKFAHCKRTFEKLDGFIRMRLRRYLSRNKDSRNKEGNLFLTNKILKNLGLKSLLGIKEKYTCKKKHIFRKMAKKARKLADEQTLHFQLELEEKGYKYEQKLILEELKKLTGLLKKLERRIGKIERKLEKENRRKT
ncbi:hypothetical protein J7J23_01505 [bacterium]|nr:hypothetical protein [bacterium]